MVEMAQHVKMAQQVAQATFRSAGPADAGAVARLHADSWRRHYRGAYSDCFLDGDVVEDRLVVWTKRLSDPDAEARTILAELGGELVGFAHTVFDEDAIWGALIDNLHVVFGLKRSGIGSRLLMIVAEDVLDRSPSSGMYLWVLEQNADAQAFYSRRGGVCAGRKEVSPPGGDPSRLTGRPFCLRYAWRNPSALLAGR
jgi:GNAT superfamily N-acetyltransferase